MEHSKKIVIGVYVEAGSASERLHASLMSIYENTPDPFELILLIDAAPEPWPQASGGFGGIRQIRIAGEGGRAACFNRLVHALQADVYVFLEHGALVGPDWMRYLGQALDADPANGLAGPSTNLCWNEQAILAHCAATPEAIEDAAAQAASRFGDAWRSLAPLHSLSDFCYAVKREVIEALGAADESYGAGPCWEMDYNIRAARAGFRGVWACAAFVYREPAPVPPQRAERQWLEAGKRRYQDKFCARLEQPGARYSAHCLGDGCAHFAQAPKITIRLPWPRAGAGAQSDTPADDALPLVSCIMPTRSRPHFVSQAIRYFQQQDYPHRELLIAYEEAADLPAAPDDPRIRYLQTPRGGSIGAKRNEAVRAAAGSIIAQWDDDDWYARQRLSRQVAPILLDLADITGLNDTLFLTLQDERYWQASRHLFRRLFAQNVCGGSLVYRRRVWDELCRYPTISLREDAEFLLGAIGKGARLCRLRGRDLFMYIRHDMNTWKFQAGRHVRQEDWRRVDAPPCLADDRAFYAARAATAPLAAPGAAAPLVSCIMPTAGRRQFVAQAIRHFLKQGYGNKELIVVDDGAEPVADLMPATDAVRYVRLERRMSIGAKRNLACAMAKGSIIAHWDDDDWMAPNWLHSQVATLLDNRADVCGLDQILFRAPALRKAWKYVYDGAKPWVCGGTLCYTKAFWEGEPFPDIDIGEDNAFVWSRRHKNIVVNDAYELYVATVHVGNTSPKQTADRRWRDHSFEAIQKILDA